ncbi:unnamed protein product [Penicillium nalgiovense]|nr:unnamed protein product [Penicillium nalgiovense]
MRASSFPSVTIDAGTVQGGRCEGQNSVFYKAIPFAGPPVKEPRFEPPKAYKQFPEGKLNATTSAPTCIQFADDFTKQELNTSALSSEDCLYLNIWAPSSATKNSNLRISYILMWMARLSTKTLTIAEYKSQLSLNLWAAQSNQIPMASLYKEFLRNNFGNAAHHLLQEPTRHLCSNRRPRPSLRLQVITDSNYKCPAWYGATQATRKGIRAWTYDFAHSPTCAWLYAMAGSDVSLFRGAHTAEIPFVFGNLDNSYLPNGTCNSTSVEWRLGGQMMDLWTAMAESAKPSTKEIEWPRFQQGRKDNLSTPGLIFENSTVSGTIDYTGCDLWIQVNRMLAASNVTAMGAHAKVNGSPMSSPSSNPSNGATSLLSQTRDLLALSVLIMGLAAF